jgi:hypothetical protein
MKPELAHDLGLARLIGARARERLSLAIAQADEDEPALLKADDASGLTNTTWRY